MLTPQALNAALLDVVAAHPALGAPVHDIVFSDSYPDEEARCYDFFVQTRRTFDHIPATTLADYEKTLDEIHWAALVAWRLFLAETNDLDEAFESLAYTQEFISAMWRMGIATDEAVTELMAAVDRDLAKSASA